MEQIKYVLNNLNVGSLHWYIYEHHITSFHIYPYILLWPIRPIQQLSTMQTYNAIWSHLTLTTGHNKIILLGTTIEILCPATDTFYVFPSLRLFLKHIKQVIVTSLFPRVKGPVLKLHIYSQDYWVHW